MIKVMGVRSVDLFYSLCQRIWSTKTWPEYGVISIFMPQNKKDGKTVCDKYRLISHASKIMLSMIKED